MKLSYIQRLFFYYLLIFAVFTAGVVLFERANEKGFKKQMVEDRLNSYVQIVESQLNVAPVSSLNTLTPLFPKELRLTVIDSTGKVLFDNEAHDVQRLQNHLGRPEIIRALKTGQGEDVRKSATLGKELLYYAKKDHGRYIRVALPYDLQIQHFLEPGDLFIYAISILFFVLLIMMLFVTRRFNKSILRLRDFVVSPDKNLALTFPNDELGEISRKITEDYLLLQRQKKSVDAERSKLLQHVKSSGEGICFFSSTTTVLFYNELFIRYLNRLCDGIVTDPEIVFSDPAFKTFQRFIISGEQDEFKTEIKRQGYTYSLKVNRFEDRGFELILSDISHQEQTKQLKKEMTGNIAHELRTPVANIRGYLETVRDQDLTGDQREHFINQAFKQSVLLSNLINDMRVLSKIEEGGDTFKMEEVNISEQLRRLEEDFDDELKRNRIKMTWEIPEHTIILANQSLIYSIFRNLIENAVRYGGEGVSIQIKLYNQDEKFYYFSFYDTGKGLPDESHLPRIFERFYRVNEGRTRDTGGTGLGLSIVKNAVLFHKGTILVKNKENAGLEFLFSLHK